MAMVGRSWLLRDPSKVRLSAGVFPSVIAVAGGSVGEVMLRSRSSTRLQMK